MWLFAILDLEQELVLLNNFLLRDIFIKLKEITFSIPRDIYNLIIEDTKLNFYQFKQHFSQLSLDVEKIEKSLKLQKPVD